MPDIKLIHRLCEFNDECAPNMCKKCSYAEDVLKRARFERESELQFRKEYEMYLKEDKLSYLDASSVLSNVLRGELN